MQYVGITYDKTKVKHYFNYKGQRFGRETKVQFTDDFYRKNYSYGNQISRYYPSTFYCVINEDDRLHWCFNNCNVYDIDPDRDIVKIVKSVPYVVVTDKDKIRAKKEKGQTWEYIWPGTLVYIFCMIFITVFNERLWGWIAATILYNNYCYEQLSR